jgi:hypothetical protein
MMTKKKRFVLEIQESNGNHAEFAFEGLEYPDLQAASEAIYGKYSYKCAVEIFGKHFVMELSETMKFSEQNLPFTMGFAGINGHSAMKLNENSLVKNVVWLQEIVLETENDEAIIGWDDIFGTLKSVNEEIGDLLEAINDMEEDIAGLDEDEPGHSKVSADDRKKLAAVHTSVTNIFASLLDVLGMEPNNVA